METGNILGKNIRAYREACGITGEALAEQMGISRQSLQMHQAGKRIPSPEHLRKYALIFGTTPEILESVPHPGSWNFVVLNKIVWQQSG